jgi:hypothetical protein
MMHKIARELPEVSCAFTPLYTDGWLSAVAGWGLLEFTTLSGQAREKTLRYLRENALDIDERGERGPYDFAVAGTDLVVPRNLRDIPWILVQEGMTDPEDWRYALVRGLGLPRYMGNTSMTGLSHAYRAFCVASDGFRDLFVGKGVDPAKLHVTGIPNFDDALSLLDNDFPMKGYVLGATSCLRETLKHENRKAFIRKSLEVANGRPLLFKLHPNEDHARARREIEALAPGAVVMDSGNTDHMVANCTALVTRYSSVVLVALALGKEIHADIPMERLRPLTPVQNGGGSASLIAQVCRRHLN